MNKPGDTLLAFNIQQARFILSQTVKVRELDSLNKLKQLRIDNLVTVVRNDSSSKLDLMKINDNHVAFQGLQTIQLGEKDKTITGLNRKLKGQKVIKWVGIIIASVGGGYLGYKIGRSQGP